MNFQAAEFEMASGLVSQLPNSEIPEIVFSGRSNVGKSSMLNKILNRKSLARVSSTPGKTITINFYRAKEVRLVDLPGYGYAKRPAAEQKRFSELVEGYFAEKRKIALVVQLVDMRHDCSKDDMQMLEFLKYMGLPFVVVMTKSDKLNKTETAQRLEAFEKQLADMPNGLIKIPFSAKSGDGTEKIKETIISYIKKYENEGNEENVCDE